MSRSPLTVVHLMWRLSRGGGVQTVVRTMGAALDPARVRLVVVTARPRRVEDGHDELPYEVVGLGHDGPRLRLWRRARLAVSALVEVRRRRPGVVQLHSGTAWMGALVPLLVGRRRPRLVIEVHDAPGSGRHGRWTDRFEGVLVRLGRATVVCHSRSVAAEVERRWRPRGLHVVPLAVDVEAFGAAAGQRERQRRDLGLDPDAFVVVVVGRLVPSKRVDLAVRAVARLGGEPVLLVVGAGPTDGEIRRVAAETGIRDRVRLLTAPSTADVASFVGAADVLVSASEYEGFGLALAEAAAAGIPVVATAVGGVPDVVVDGVTGLLVPPGDEVALAGALARLAGDADLRAALGRAGGARARQRFTPVALAAAFTDLYEQTARSR